MYGCIVGNHTEIHEHNISLVFSMKFGSVIAFHSIVHASSSAPLLIPCEEIYLEQSKKFVVEHSLSIIVVVQGEECEDGDAKENGIHRILDDDVIGLCEVSPIPPYVLE